MYALSTEPTYQFGSSEYATTEGPNAHIRVVVRQIVQGVQDVLLILTPLTYAQYIARRNQQGSTLPPIDQYHDSRPSNAHRKYLPRCIVHSPIAYMCGRWFVCVCVHLCVCLCACVCNSEGCQNL